MKIEDVEQLSKLEVKHCVVSTKSFAELNEELIQYTNEPSAVVYFRDEKPSLNYRSVKVYGVEVIEE